MYGARTEYGDQNMNMPIFITPVSSHCGTHILKKETGHAII